MSTEIVALSQLNDLLNKTGNNTDTIGTTSVFARLAQISAYVDTLETLLGLNTDAAGTTTIFARLSQIAGYTDTLETVLGLTSDAASGTGSVMARLAQLVSVLSTVNTNVNSANTTISTINTNVNTANTNINTTNIRIGANTDASGTSTLFALLKKLDAKTSVAIDKSAATPFSLATTVNLSTTLSTIYSVSGKGYLDYATISANGSAGTTLRVTVDGVVKFHGTTPSALGSVTGIFKRDYLLNNSTNNLAIPSPGTDKTISPLASGNLFGYPYTANQNTGPVSLITDSIYFNSSLVIEALSSIASNTHSYTISGGVI